MMLSVMQFFWRRIYAVYLPFKRFAKIAGPYWFAEGIWSFIGLAVVAVGFVEFYKALSQATTEEHLKNFTEWILAALKPGYGHFALWYGLPAVLASAVVVLLVRRFWPKNPNANGLLLLGILLVLMASVNQINVVLNFAFGDITNAAVHKNGPLFWMEVYRLLTMFVMGTFIVVFYSFVQARLKFSWVQWLVKHYVDKYFQKYNYYRINWMPHIDNPDERIANDVDAVVDQALDLLLKVLLAILTYNAFIGILEDADPTKLLKPICYIWSAGFTVLALFFGGKLTGINFNQLRLKADFRYYLIHVRNKTESIAFYGAEEREKSEVLRRFDLVLTNWNQLIGWTRNFGFLSSSSDYFTVAIPYIVLAPMLIAGTVEVGSINQTSGAFAQILSALTLVVANFGMLAEFTAIINRLYSFVEALDAPPAEIKNVIASQEGTAVTIDRVTLMTPDDQQELVHDLSLQLHPGERIVIMGDSGVGKSSLLRALAGFPDWNHGSGTITRLRKDKMFFLPQRPDVGLGSLRDILIYPRTTTTLTDEELLHTLDLVNLPKLAARYAGSSQCEPASGSFFAWIASWFIRKDSSIDVDFNKNGLDTVRNWTEELSLGEQQRLAFARVFLMNAEVVFLDEATSALDVNNEEKLYTELEARNISCMSVGHRPTLVKFHHKKLEMMGKSGGWTLKSTAA